MTLTQVAKVARREYLARVRNRAFIAMTVMVPVFLGIYLIGMPVLTRSRNRDVRIAVLDAGTGLRALVASRLAAIEQPHVVVIESVDVDAQDTHARDRFSRDTRERTIDGYLLLDAEDEPVHARYFARETGNGQLMRELRLATQAAVLSRLLSNTGVDEHQVRQAQQLELSSVTVSDRGEVAGGFAVALVSTIAMAMLLYIAVLINGQGMATAIVEEKSSRLIEVILGAVTATEFMVGKILGVLGSGLTQLGVWVVVALAIGIVQVPAFAMTDTAGLDFFAVVNARTLFYFAVFFSLGYALYSVLFAVIAVTCTSTEELGQSMMAAVLPMVVAMMVAMSVISNPSTTMTRLLSLVPFFTPLVMMARVNVLMPPLWEVWLSIALLAATTIAASWLAARIFDYALLMTGKRPTLPELMQVIRAGAAS
jgi:ABC-2 type transport system permease protein